MKTFTCSWITILIIMFAAVAFAGNPSLKIGTGGEKGNYFAMGNDIYTYCSEAMPPELMFEILNSGGSVHNITGMSNKEFSGGIAQEDVLQYLAKQDPRKVNINRMKIISGMHMETVYLLIPKNFKPRKVAGQKSMWGKFSGMFGGDDVDTSKVKISLDMLEGQDVASWGGSIISGKALQYFMGVNFNMIDIPKDQRAALNMPILMVGGNPYQPVQDYLATGKFVLVGIDHAKVSSKAPFYMPVSANYDIGGKAYSVPTIGVRALLLGKSFRKEERNANMGVLAQCISDNLADLADDPDTNANWNSVYELEDSNNQTNWSYFPVK